MKTLKYIWRNVMRNKIRSVLTILSVGFSLALMTVLHGYLYSQSLWGDEAAKHNRVVVMNIQGFSGAVPIAYVDDVRGTPGVNAAVQYSWYGGDYKEEQMPFAQFGTDPEHVFDVWTEFQIAPEQLKAWQSNRRGCVADRRLAAKRNWQIGERIPIKGTFYPFNLDLELVGLFDSPMTTEMIWFDWKYLDEGLKQAKSFGTGNSGTIFAKVEDPNGLANVCAAIDTRFASSPNPTRTQTESAFAQMFTDMLGNIQLYIQLIGLCVVFSLCFVAATTMAMSIRERTTEIAVLKAIGFSQLRVLWMVLGESCLIALIGGIIGVGIGAVALQVMHGISVQIVQYPVMEMIGLWMVYLLLAAIAVGFVSGVVPAIRAARLSVIDGLRRVV